MKKNLARLASFLSLAGFCTGCSMMTSSPKEEKHQLELSLHKVRTDVEEIKHDLNTYEIEHHILEGKLIDQEQLISSLKDQIAQLKRDKLQSFVDELHHLNERLEQIAAKQQQEITDIRQLSSHANGTTTALSQYKIKIAELEKTVFSHQHQLQDIIDLKTKIAALAADSHPNTYTVRSGDSLAKISRRFNLSVEDLKSCNDLSNDHIVPGQTLQLPPP